MFAMLTKRVPFDGKSDQEIINNILYRPINFKHKEFKNMSLDCVDLLKSMLFHDEKNRYSAAACFDHNWL